MKMTKNRKSVGLCRVADRLPRARVFSIGVINNPTLPYTLFSDPYRGWRFSPSGLMAFYPIKDRKNQRIHLQVKASVGQKYTI
jgi:hypothetical protein